MSEYNDRLDAEIARADARIRETGDRVTAHLGRTGPVTGKATSPDGAITVVVGPGGRLIDLDISNAALTMKPEQLADMLVKLAGQASRSARSRMRQSMSQVVNPDVVNHLTELGFSSEAGDEEVDWVNVIRRGGR